VKFTLVKFTLVKVTLMSVAPVTTVFMTIAAAAPHSRRQALQSGHD
jgi:hypothetical protein